MSVTAFSGSAWGIPASGAIVSLETAEVGAVLGAIGGVARTLALASGGLVLAVGAAAAFCNLVPGFRIKVGIDRLAAVNAKDRSFRGVCTNETIRIKCDGSELILPSRGIKKMRFSSYSDNSIKFTLFDGSVYRGVVSEPKLDFVTSIGMQTVLPESLSSVSGGSVSDMTELRQNVDEYLEGRALDIERVLGERSFADFFQR